MVGHTDREEGIRRGYISLHAYGLTGSYVVGTDLHMSALVQAIAVQVYAYGICVYAYGICVYRRLTFFV